VKVADLGLTCGPRSPRAHLKPAEEFVLLRHALCLTLSEERLAVPRLLGSAGEPPWALEAQGACLRPGPWLAPKARVEAKDRV
jgi:hypothetical protein